MEVRYDDDDEACEDGVIDAALEQSNDDSDSCTEASDNDSFRDADDTSTLKEDGDPCVVDRQLEEQDETTYVAADISHVVDDFAPQQSGDTCEDSHMLAPRVDELPMRSVTHLSPFQAPTTATS